MGTNFYFATKDNNEYRHIGKRSAAGLYCWDCGVTLCSTIINHVDIFTGNIKNLYGTDAVHHSGAFWLDKCPLCYSKETEEPITKSAPGRELGFNTSAPRKKSGVSTCCSFLWAISPQYFAELSNAKSLFIRDEYDDVYTNEQFRDAMLECPIKYYHSVGEVFC